jgi:hypothetical protein
MSGTLCAGSRYALSVKMLAVPYWLTELAVDEIAEHFAEFDKV